MWGRLLDCICSNLTLSKWYLATSKLRPSSVEYWWKHSNVSLVCYLCFLFDWADQIIIILSIQQVWLLLKCRSPKIFYFLIWNYTILKELLRKNFVVWTKRDFFTNFWSLHFCGTPATLVTQTSRLTYDVMWRKLRNSHYLSFTSCTQKRSITGKNWITMSSQEESFSELLTFSCR